MQNKGLRFGIVFIFLLSISLASAANYAQTQEDAYNCLLTKVEGTACNQVRSLEDKIFSLLATGECKPQVLEASQNNGECWPKNACTIEETAKAVLALNEADADTQAAEDWLTEHTTTPEGMDWFIQVDTDGASECEITYDGSSTVFTFTLEENKKITNTPSNLCLTPYRDNYWLKIGDSCLDRTFTISCDEGFSSNLLYKESEADVYYVSLETHGAVADGSTDETVNSLCFSEGNFCDYEGSLWATLALDVVGADVTTYLPYTVAGASADENEQYLPEAFVYQLREYPESRSLLLAKQTPQGYWRESASRYYDTAVALLPFQNENPSEKETAQEWLNNTQRDSGCWGEGADEIGNTAFLLYSVWPRYDLGPECYEDNECNNNEQCFLGTCIPDDGECAEDRHCSDGVCIDYQCVECRYDDECSGDLICSKDNACVECEYNSDCTALNGEGFACNTNTNECYELPECTDQSDCEAGEQCISGYCLGGFPECSDDTDCGDEYCVNDTCVECRLNSHCESGYICSANSCILDGDTCIDNEDCAADETCDNGVCVAEKTDCTDAGYFCRSRSACILDSGSILSSYACSGTDKCCSEGIELQTCSQKGGDVCRSNEQCVGGQSDTLVSGISGGQVCCIGGTCEGKAQISDCQLINPSGICRSSCYSDENSVNDACDDPLDVCCVTSSSGSGNSKKTSTTSLWILGILVILVILGIVFREKLRVFWLQFKSRFGSSSSRSPRGPGFPPPPSSSLMMRRPFPQRRILPPQPRGPAPQPRRAPLPPPKKASGELDDVLKKLKEIGK